ncbi:MAG: hypothetical protein P8L20_10370 [Flavobacteriales bacterium]|nr:hypothetical protein [Flavobacteriales bacterium]
MKKIEHKSFFKGNTFVLGFFILMGSTGLSQHQNIPISYAISQKIEKSILLANQNVHTAIKPFQQTFISSSSYASVFNDSGVYYYDFTVKLFQENLLNIKEEDVFLTADPLFNFVAGRTNYMDTTTGIYTNTRGVRVSGNITSKFSFETRYYENQFYYPEYLDSVADARGVAFGLGRAKTFKGKGQDVGMSSGYISYSPVKEFNIQFGQGKHFIGDGYRSMLLSDNAFNYPYLSLSLNLLDGKLFYKTVNAWMQTLERMPLSSSPEALFKRKSASFHYLSFKPKKQLEIGFFEGIIFRRYQDSVGEIDVDPAFYIPIIGVGSGLNANNDENKVVFGINMNVVPIENVKIYGQFVMDDFSKTGFQLGWKWFELFKAKNSWLMLEYNSAVPYLFSKSSKNIIQNYSHANQELAHPLGASFNELVVMAHFEKNRFFATAKYFYAQKERFGGSIYGENIFLPNDAVLIAAASEKINWNYLGGELGLNLNIKTRMQIFGNAFIRSESGNNWSNNEWFWQIGMRTTLNNFYYEQ